MSIKLLIVTVLLLTTVMSKPSFALGKLGHQMVCQLAFEHLPVDKQTKVTELLNAIPKEHQNLINSYNYQKPNTVISFANACTWADAIKRLSEFKAYNTWHYMNVSRKHTEIKAGDCDKNCLPRAILEHQNILSQGTLSQNSLLQSSLFQSNKHSTWQQAQALLFLGHWLGDIHQPLHTSFADDFGGNKVEFSHLETKCSNLHWYWDQCILYKGKNSKTTWLALLREKWQQQSQPDWQAKQVWQWADESFQITRHANFNYCQINAQGSCQQSLDKIKLPSGYLKQYQPVMEQRLLQAAQRLTKLLATSL